MAAASKFKLGTSWLSVKGAVVHWAITAPWILMQIIGPVHMRTSHVPKDVSERDSALSWFESLILALVNAKLFQIRLLKHTLKRKKRAFWIMIRVRKPDSRTCERKALSERDSCMCILEMRAEAMLKPCMGQLKQRGLRSRNKILPRSAQILIVIGKAFVMHVNARSSNHHPNHVLDCDLKRLLERDSFSCEHSHCFTKDRTLYLKVCVQLWTRQYNQHVYA